MVISMATRAAAAGTVKNNSKIFCNDHSSIHFSAHIRYFEFDFWFTSRWRTSSNTFGSTIVHEITITCWCTP
jgi:hypothetical protein